ncbi:MAG: hypothetical protein AAFO85_20570, partial [Cyanobacteria bacterium J06598_4]
LALDLIIGSAPFLCEIFFYLHLIDSNGIVILINITNQIFIFDPKVFFHSFFSKIYIDSEKDIHSKIK